jgi:hypothetical protein
LELEENIKELYQKEPEIREYDKYLKELNDLVFESPMLVEIREIYDNCCYILEMAQ